MVVPPSSVVVVAVSDAVSDAVEESSVDAQELTPSVRTDTRTRMSRKYLRKLKLDIILLHGGIENLNYSVSIILLNQPLIFENCRPKFTICQHLYTLGVEVCFTRKWEDCGGLSVSVKN